MKTHQVGVGFTPYLSCDAPNYGFENSPLRPLCRCQCALDRGISRFNDTNVVCSRSGPQYKPEPGGGAALVCNCTASADRAGVTIQETLQHVGQAPVYFPLFGRSATSRFGSWFSTPKGGECSGSKQLGDGGCSWKLRPIVRVIRYEDLVSAGWQLGHLCRGQPCNELAVAHANLAAFKAAWTNLSSFVKPAPMAGPAQLKTDDTVEIGVSTADDAVVINGSRHLHGLDDTSGVGLFAAGGSAARPMARFVAADASTSCVGRYPTPYPTPLGQKDKDIRQRFVTDLDADAAARPLPWQTPHAFKSDDIATVRVVVDRSEPIHRVLDAFVSFTIDSASLCEAGWSFPSHVDTVTLTRLRLLAKPGLVIRFGGTSADNEELEAPSAPMLPRLPSVLAGPLGKDGCNVTATKWKQLASFTEAINASLVYGLDSLLRQGAAPDGAIDLRNAAALFKLAADSLSRASLLGFELGNEPLAWSQQHYTNLTARQHAKDFIALQKALHASALGSKVSILGPDVYGLTKRGGAATAYVADFVGNQTPVDIVTIHMYSLMDIGNVSVATFYNESRLSVSARSAVAARQIVDKQSARGAATRLWVGEGSPAWRLQCDQGCGRLEGNITFEIAYLDVRAKTSRLRKLYALLLHNLYPACPDISCVRRCWVPSRPTVSSSLPGKVSTPSTARSLPQGVAHSPASGRRFSGSSSWALMS